MEPKDPNKKFDDLFKNINFSFTVPIGFYNLNRKVETTEEAIARLDEVDAVVDTMTTYPTAQRMLNDLFTKES